MDYIFYYMSCVPKHQVCYRNNESSKYQKFAHTISFIECNITSIGNLSPKVRDIQCSSLPKLHTISPFPVNLRNCTIYNCKNLTKIGPINNTLKTLNISSCLSLTEIPKLPPSLQKLSCQLCPSLFSLPKLPETIISVSIRFCPRLSVICWSDIHKFSPQLVVMVEENYKVYRYIQTRLFVEKIKEELISRVCSPARYENWTDDLSYYRKLE